MERVCHRGSSERRGVIDRSPFYKAWRDRRHYGLFIRDGVFVDLKGVEFVAPRLIEKFSYMLKEPEKLTPSPESLTRKL